MSFDAFPHDQWPDVVAALEGVAAERVAEGEVESRGRLIVVLGERLLGVGEIERCAAGCLVVLGGVVVFLLVEDLEADIDGAVLDVGL